MTRKKMATTTKKKALKVIDIIALQKKQIELPLLQKMTGQKKEENPTLTVSSFFFILLFFF